MRWACFINFIPWTPHLYQTFPVSTMIKTQSAGDICYANDYFTRFSCAASVPKEKLSIITNNVIMIPMTSQITGISIVYSTVCWGAAQRKHQSSASVAFVWRIHGRPVDSLHKRRVTRKMFPFDDVIKMLFSCRPTENGSAIRGVYLTFPRIMTYWLVLLHYAYENLEIKKVDYGTYKIVRGTQ